MPYDTIEIQTSVGMMGSSKNIAFLSSPFLRSLKLDTSDYATLATTRLTPKRYPPHTTITHQGMPEERAFIVQSGWGCLYRDLPEGERQIVDFVLTGDAVGLRPRHGEAQYTFLSITELHVTEANARTLVSALTRSPVAAEALLSMAWRQSKILAEHLTNLGRRTALVRTAHLLLELGARLEAVSDVGAEGYDCPLTQYDLADALGLTAIHVNRMLRELREYGLLSLRRNRVEFLDYEGLIRLTNFDRQYLHT